MNSSPGPAGLPVTRPTPKYDHFGCDESTPLSLASLLSSLSCALDLTEGQPMGHAVRTCLIGLRLAQVLRLPAVQRTDLHLALLLKDAGCSSNAARMFSLFGCDDITAKRDSKIRDWCRLSEAVKFAVRHTLPHAGLQDRLWKMGELLGLPERAMDALTIARCTRGADIAQMLGLSPGAVETIYNLDEHWDGQGAPHHKSGEAIPLLARIAGLAQTMEVFVTTYGVKRAFEVMRERSGRWFDPDLVRAAADFEHDSEFWEGVQSCPYILLEASTAEILRDQITDASMDAVCDAFAQIIDAKSSFTAAHSSRVADWTERIADRLGFDTARQQTLRRAALLHDLGKLAVPNLILDKPGSLTESEYAVVKRHPFYTEQILRPIIPLSRLTEIAVAHHEKLDGSGYYRGLTAESLDIDQRLLAVADIFDALTAERPYREALPTETALAIVAKEAGTRLDRDCVTALKEEVRSL